MKDEASQIFEWTKTGQLKNYYSLCLEIENNNEFVMLNKCDDKNLNQRWSYDDEVAFLL